MCVKILLLQEVDALALGVYPTLERKKKMDFGYIVIAESCYMVVPRPGEEPRLFAFIRPFTPIVNMLIIYSYYGYILIRFRYNSKFVM